MGQRDPVTFESLLAQVRQLSVRDKVRLLEAVLPEIASTVEGKDVGSLNGCYGVLSDLGAVASGEDIEETRKGMVVTNARVPRAHNCP